MTFGARPPCRADTAPAVLPPAGPVTAPAADLPQSGGGGFFPQGPFDLIMADPPWHFATRSQKGVTPKGAGGQYATRDLDWIKSLPVASIAAPDCLLWLWATNPLLPQALEVMAAWGVTFKTAGHWSKKTKNGRQSFGTGYILRCAGEPFLIGTIGKPKTSRSVRSVIEGLAREHSRKPDEAFAAAESLMPSARRIELFSRQRREGWTVWGDQIDHFGIPHDAGSPAGASTGVPADNWAGVSMPRPLLEGIL